MPWPLLIQLWSTGWSDGQMDLDHSGKKGGNDYRYFKEYSFSLGARDLLYAPPHIQDTTYHILCYSSCQALAGTGNSSVRTGHSINEICPNPGQWMDCCYSFYLFSYLWEVLKQIRPWVRPQGGARVGIPPPPPGKSKI